MKILYVADRINSSDGSSVHCRAFIQSSFALGHDVVSYPKMGAIPAASVNVSPKEKNLIYYLKMINANTLKRYLHRSNPYISELTSYLDGMLTTAKDYIRLNAIAKRFSPDAVVFRYRLFNFAPFLVAKKYNIPLVCEINALKSMESSIQARKGVATILTRWGERKAICGATAISTVSKAIKAKIETYAVATGTTVAVVPNGVDLEKFKPDDNRRDEIKARLNLEGKRVLGYVGSYQSWHGLDTTLDVMERLVKADPKYHLLLIGRGTEYNKITNLIEQKNLSASVTQTGSIAHDEIPTYLSAFDYALMTYPKLDNFYFSPLKMFEYMAMGIQVVSTDVGQISEIINHRENGWLVDPPTAENFYDTILEAEKMEHEIGQNARRLMQQHYSWDRNAEKILQLANWVK